ncbi:hypothetical protein FOL47_009975 [Perkinsus chesapeaki]|uniref:Uncharacterized protein n=1 Tax=Perkinsus chesapeaki TaxID=330153 RepID=A0A7J6L5I8_PERCH|nr:hypothetical protein FOL47_009975 [Perkinsus chesapeaki]
MVATSSGIRAVRRTTTPIDFAFLGGPALESKPKSHNNREDNLCNVIRGTLERSNYNLGRWIHISSQLSSTCEALPPSMAAVSAAALVQAKSSVPGFQPDALLSTRLIDRALIADVTGRSCLLLVYSALDLEEHEKHDLIGGILERSHEALINDADLMHTIELAYIVRRHSVTNYPRMLQILMERLSTANSFCLSDTSSISSLALGLTVLNDLPENLTIPWREQVEQQLITSPMSRGAIRIFERGLKEESHMPCLEVVKSVISSQAIRQEPTETSIVFVKAIAKLKSMDETITADLAWECGRLLASRIYQLTAMEAFDFASCLSESANLGPVGEILVLDRTLMSALGEVVAVERHRMRGREIHKILQSQEVCRVLGIDDTIIDVMRRRLFCLTGRHAARKDG